VSLRSLPVPDGLAGERVDAGLSRLLGLSRTRAAELAADGAVRLDGREVGKSDRLVPGAWLEVDVPDAAPAAVEVVAEPVPGMGIVYDDDDVVVVRSARRLGSVGWAVTLGLLLGGALGNLTDRLLRSPGFGRGHVVDFIDYAGLFIGNVADVAIVVAALAVAVQAVRGIGLDGRRTHADAAAGPSDEQHRHG
jgi:23S rRNA pseudouridine1911/1915/1917 synthase